MTGRLFRIRMRVDDLIRGWTAELTATDRKSPSKTRRLELVNLLLPTQAD